MIPAWQIGFDEQHALAATFNTPNQFKKKERKEQIEAPIQQRWSPYVDNGGSCIALAGKGYAIIAGDTRLSDGFSIVSRNTPKLSQLTDSCVLASAGMQADRVSLHKNIGVRLQWYEYNNGAKPGVRAVSQMLSNMLYGHRFFPIYAFNLLAGVDSEGNGVVFSYDVVGCTEPLNYGCTGTGEALIEPLLDNQVLRQHQSKSGGVAEYSIDEALELIKDAFTSACERDINTGDSVEIYVITKNGIKKEQFELKRD
eukprot:NODE_1229_length_1019_cov_334.634021_g943_i0.p1 GENE.NODE_1229_length_1019_cov_334.634021_g943_i0~~NODE_1229_length_1019_cov_334.634021_g943_i0.p1  ORF type:complete len:274 (-),score=86.26 NODE_1229_length_1019_cov_334.634021_g943_i0:196-960(-)